ncbi:hypothetical protein KKB99_04160 [bacterium]|nr:hypothetical protein [bacterium]MBU1025187.1 hypothetical protein [bacterium]
MATVSISVPDELKKKMEAQEQVNWSAVARNAFENKIIESEEIELFKKIVKSGKMSEKFAKKLGANINRNVTNRLIDEYNRRYKHIDGGINKARKDD